MAEFLVKRKDLIQPRGESGPVAIRKERFDVFDAKIVGMAGTARSSEEIPAVAVFLDLEGFTNFCSQQDPHLVIPQFIHQFTAWTLEKLKSASIAAETADGYVLRVPLPFFVKFTGDGFLLLWDIAGWGDQQRADVVALLSDLTSEYRKAGTKHLRASFSRVPKRLRCGIAQGKVFRVGNPADYVGPCINLAGRLQKQGALTIAVGRKGFDLDRYAGLSKKWICKRITVRGIGEELIWVKAAEFAALPPADAQEFEEP